MAQTIRTRFIASFAANVLRSGITFVSGMLLARWLGPQDYGRMAFLLASFVAVRQLLDMGSSSAFFTFLSQRQRSRRFVSYFWRWVGIQFLVSLAVLGLWLPEDWVRTIWTGEDRRLVLLAFCAAFMQGVVWPIASQMAEAQRETIKAQRINTLVVLMHFGVVLSLWRLEQLAIPLVFAALILEWGAAGWYVARLYRQDDEGTDHRTAPCDTARSVLGEFWRYCLPFVPYAWLSFVHDFADRWMLQHWGGAAEQGYFAIASQFATVALLATSSILRIFWKEIAEAHHRKDHAKVQRLYLKVSRGLYFVGAVMAGGLLPWATEIIQLALGASYVAGSLTLMLMFLYPVHQCIGQIAGTMLYATERTGLQVKLGLSFMTVNLVVAYFLMAPGDAVIPGMNFASQGLAYKMVIMQAVQVNITMWFIARAFGWKYDWGYQVAGLALAAAAGWLAKMLAIAVVHSSMLAALVLGGGVHLILAACIVLSIPWVAGLERKDLMRLIRMQDGAPWRR